MAIISSRVFDIGKGVTLEAVLEEAARSIRSDPGIPSLRELFGGRITVTVEDAKPRLHKRLALQAVRSMAAGVDNPVWKQGEYELNFQAWDYRWKGEELYLTAGEELCLFRTLILKQPRRGQDRAFLRNMRKRFGDGFLREVLNEDKESKE